MRKLATIQKIDKLYPIEKADKIEVAKVLGWECVVKKGDFKPGELCVYFEVDSKLPPIEAFDFMQPYNYRVRTIKLRGQYSQGLVMPLSTFPKLDTVKKEEGLDVTELLGVTKYDPQWAKEKKQRQSQPMLKWKRYLMRFAWFRWYIKNFEGVRSDGFPKWLKKTDETRIQNYPRVAAANEGLLCYATEKLDGQSATFAYANVHYPNWYPKWMKKKQFFVCSRNLTLWKPNHNNKYWHSALKYHIEDRLKQVPFNVCIQGEQCGPGIQENRYGFTEQRLFIFNVDNLDTGERLGKIDLIQFCNDYGFEYVPVLFDFKLDPKLHDVEWFLQQAETITTIDMVDPILREGNVYRQFDTAHNPLSFKARSRPFLEKYEE